MKHDKDRGISVGTILMMSLTLLVLVMTACVLPGLMGSGDVRMESGAMDVSMDLGTSVRALSLDEIPIAQPSAVPDTAQTTPEPERSVDAPPVAELVSEVSAAPSVTPGYTDNNIALTFGGSVVMDDMIRKSGYYSDSQKYDYAENLSLIADALDSDLTLVTLEAITDPTRNVKLVPNAPDSALDMLAGAQIDIVALGYSHAFDYGLSGVEATVREARIRNLTTLGVCTSPEDAASLCMVDVKGKKIACLHYTMGLSKTGKSAVKKADAAYAVSTASISDYGNVLDDILRAREQGADFIVVSLNWSNAESSADYTKARAFLQDIADSGADVIVGAGTKAIKPVKWLTAKDERQTLCALSLGSLLIGERKDGNVAGMLLHVTLKDSADSLHVDSVTYTPTYIWRFEQDDQMRYRVVESDQPAPDGMGQDHVKYAENALKNLMQWLGDSPIKIRTK